MYKWGDQVLLVQPGGVTYPHQEREITEIPLVPAKDTNKHDIAIQSGPVGRFKIILECFTFGLEDYEKLATDSIRNEIKSLKTDLGAPINCIILNLSPPIKEVNTKINFTIEFIGVE